MLDYSRTEFYYSRIFHEWKKVMRLHKENSSATTKEALLYNYYFQQEGVKCHTMQVNMHGLAFCVSFLETLLCDVTGSHPIVFFFWIISMIGCIKTI